METIRHRRFNDSTEVIGILIKEIEELKKDVAYLKDYQNTPSSPCSSVKSAEIHFETIYKSGPTGPNSLTRLNSYVKPNSFVKTGNISS